MRAVVQDRYGDADAVLKLAEIDTPLARAGEVLVRVRAASVNQQDCHVVTGIPYVIRASGYGLLRPNIRVRGTDVAGVVEAVGDGVTRFAPGDEVVGWCDGAFAEYGCAPQEQWVSKPAELSFEEAGCIGVAAFTALRGVRDVGAVKAGEKVLVNGASGGVGTFAVMIAKSLGAEVTGVCSGGNAEMVRSLGADHVIDYSAEDFTRGTERYDALIDGVANHSLSACRGVLTPAGRYVLISNSGGRLLGPLVRFAAASVTSLFVSQKLGALVSENNHDDLVALGEMAATGALRPVIERTYPLEDAIDAIRHVSDGHTRGKVVITMQGVAPT